MYIRDIHIRLGEQDASEIPEKMICISSLMTQSQVKEACVEMVTREKIPFSVLDSKAFKTLTEQIFAGLSMQAITSKYIMNLVNEKYLKVKEKITSACMHRQHRQFI